MKVVYLGIHWQSDIRSWINLTKPKLEIQLLVDNLRKPKPFVCSTRQWLCAAGKPRSCKCASLSALCCPEIIILGFCCCRIKNCCFLGFNKFEFWDLKKTKSHLIHKDNQLQVGRNSMVDGKRDLCRGDFGACWKITDWEDCWKITHWEDCWKVAD